MSRAEGGDVLPVVDVDPVIARIYWIGHGAHTEVQDGVLRECEAASHCGTGHEAMFRHEATGGA